MAAETSISSGIVSDDKGQSFLQRILFLIMILAFLSDVLVGGGLILQRYKAANIPGFAVLVVSPQSPVIDELNSYESALNGRLDVRTYAEPNMRKLVAWFPGGEALARAQRPVVIVPQKKGDPQLISDPAKVTALLAGEAKAAASARFPLIPVAIIVGFLAGCFVKPSNSSVVLFCTLALLAAVYKSLHACPVCPVERFLGVPLEFWGIASYLGATMALVFRPSERRVVFGIGVLSAIAICVQLFLFWTSVEICPPCTIISSANGAILVACLMRLKLPVLVAPPLSYRLLVPAGGLAMLTLAQAYGSQMLSISEVASRHLDRPLASVRGKPASFIEIKTQRPREVIALVSDTCGVCGIAKAWLASHPSVPVRLVRILPPGQTSTGPAEIRPQPSKLASVPRFLFVDHGLIIEDRAGWSTDSEWDLLFERDVTSFLAEQGENKEKK